MTPLSRLEERYHNDAAFHAVVDSMQRLILDLELSPSEIREAAMFACYLVEMRRPTPRIPFGNDPDGGPYRSSPQHGTDKDQGHG